MTDQPNDGEEEQRDPSPAERITLAIGIALILGLMALVTYLTFAGGDDPPSIAATPLIEEMRSDGATFYVPIEIVNHGDRPAQDAIVRAALATGGDTAEEAEITVDFLAAGETSEGVAVFSHDPTVGQLKVDVVSFR